MVNVIHIKNVNDNDIDELGEVNDVNVFICK